MMYHPSIQYYLNQIKYFFKRKSVLSQLILINIVVFISVNLIDLFLWLCNININVSSVPGISKVTYWLSVPSNLHYLIQRPWTLFTYMFLQENFFHILFNMIVLYFAGIIFTEFLDDKKLLSTYIFGGLTGAFFYIFSYNIFPVFNNVVSQSVALGASASVLAILVAIATYVPNYSVMLFLIGKIKLKHIAIILIIIDILSINKGNPGGHIAHLGGALWGYVSIILLRKGYDFSEIFSKYNLKKFFLYYKKPKKVKFKNIYHNKSERPLSDEEYNRKKAEKQKKIDKILDKISKSGYESLTKEEKEFLFNASNKK